MKENHLNITEKGGIETSVGNKFNQSSTSKKGKLRIMEPKLMKLVNNFEKTAKVVRHRRHKSREKALRIKWRKIMHFIFVVAAASLGALFVAVLIFDEKPSVHKMVSDINVIKNLL